MRGVKTDTPHCVYWRVPHAAPIQVRDARIRLRVSKDGLDAGTSYIDALSDELRASWRIVLRREGAPLLVLQYSFVLPFQ